MQAFKRERMYQPASVKTSHVQLLPEWVAPTEQLAANTHDLVFGGAQQ